MIIEVEICIRKIETSFSTILLAGCTASMQIFLTDFQSTRQLCRTDLDPEKLSAIKKGFFVDNRIFFTDFSLGYGIDRAT